MMQNKCVFSMQ